MGIQRIYRRTTPYPHDKLSGLDHVQTSDVLYAAHPDYVPQKLTRFAHTDWRWSSLTFGPTLAAPTGISTGASAPNTTGYHGQLYQYLVTRISEEYPVQESRASVAVGASNDLTLAGNYNTISLPPLAGASRHVIYKKMGGSFGYIGNTAEDTFRDENLLPVLSEAPPEGYNPFSAAGKYPGALTLHQQRLALAATTEVINGAWLSRSGDLENMDRARPLRSDDSLQFALVAEQANAIKYILSLDLDLLAFTSDGVWAISGGESGVLTPSAIVPKRQTGRGASDMKPILVDNVVFYATSRGRSLRALNWSFEIEGYKSDNVSIFAPHLFKRYGLKRAAFQSEPMGIIWVLREDGALLAFTWEQEQQVWGWSPIETEGTVEDIAVITEAGFDRLYLIVTRTIAGVERRFLERMALPHQDDITEACHLDCSISQEFEEPQNVIGGLWHLEGETVSAVFDGFVAHGLTVAGGQIILPNAATGTLVHVGLRYEGEVETLPDALTSSEGTAHVNRQQIKDVVVRTIDTIGISVGISGSDNFEQLAPEDGDFVDDGSDAIDHLVPVDGDWKNTSTVIIKQTEPLPAHIVALFPSQRIARI